MKLVRRFVLLAVALGAAAVLFAAYKSNHAPDLSVATWTGDYGLAQKSAQMSVFARTTGADVRFAVYDGGTAEIARQVAARAVRWDVADMELSDAVAACQAGLLEKISVPANDFVPGAVGPCWVATAVYARVAAFDPARFGGLRPQRLSDVFDLKRFAGPRALNDTPKGNLEMALLADGVPSADVYRTLSTPAGLARAFAKLSTLKPALVWAQGGETPLSLVTGGRAAFAMVLNGDLPSSGLSAIWDGQQYAFDVLAIPKGARHRQLAGDYIRFATSIPVLGAFSSWLPYGPPRLAARALVGRNPATKISMVPYQPTAGGRMAHALAVDETWWLAHAAAMDLAWRAWRAAP